MHRLRRLRRRRVRLCFLFGGAHVGVTTVVVFFVVSRLRLKSHRLCSEGTSDRKEGHIQIDEASSNMLLARQHHAICYSSRSLHIVQEEEVVPHTMFMLGVMREAPWNMMLEIWG